MDQTKETKAKIGADGLTKKERRALKVNAAAASKPNTPNSNVSLEKGQKKNSQTILNDTSNEVAKSNDLQTNANNELSKVESKAQRRALQETQRLAKANAKNTDKASGKSSKINEVVSIENKSEPSKAELKAQRRALQEAQRLAKANSKVEQQVQQKEKSPQQQKDKLNDKAVMPVKKNPVKIKTVAKNKHKVQLFNHLYFETPEVGGLESKTVNEPGVHAAFVKLGAQYSSKTIIGSNARCLAMLSALKVLINDFVTPPKQEFCRSLESTLKTCTTHLNNCRPLAVSMTNALRHFKLYLTQMDTNLTDDEKRDDLLNNVKTYISDQIDKAGEAITLKVLDKIINNDVILTYGCSSLITKILLEAYKEGRIFKVIIVDGRPLLEGREMLRKLVCAGIQCSYVLINAASFVMNKVTKVLLGAHALLANGYVMSRSGTAQVALIANAYKKPILVCCETYKFCERAQTDSFVYNEIGDPDQIVTIDTLEENSPLMNWKNTNCLTPLNLMYDVTPPDLVTAVVTELALLPCTSVPVILRMKPTV